MAEGVLKNGVPVVPHGQKDYRRIPLGLFGSSRDLKLQASQRTFRLLEPIVLVTVFKLPFDKRPQARAKQFKHFADTLMIGDRHGSAP